MKSMAQDSAGQPVTLSAGGTSEPRFLRIAIPLEGYPHPIEVRVQISSELQEELDKATAANMFKQFSSEVLVNMLFTAIAPLVHAADTPKKTDNGLILPP